VWGVCNYSGNTDCRLKTEGFQGQTMRDHTKLRAFKLAEEVAMLVYRETAGFPKKESY
jgi:hypothetical protein